MHAHIYSNQINVWSHLFYSKNNKIRRNKLNYIEIYQDNKQYESTTENHSTNITRFVHPSMGPMEIYSIFLHSLIIIVPYNNSKKTLFLVWVNDLPFSAIQNLKNLAMYQQNYSPLAVPF